MTEDEKLVEKVAEAMWNCATGLSWQDTISAGTHRASLECYRRDARAAIACVREHDRPPLYKLDGETGEMSLVHADSTGAERSSDLSAGWQESKCGTYFEPVNREMQRCICGRYPESYCDFCKGRLAAFTFGPTDDRSAPAASREPDLPSSLTVRHRHKGGIQG